MFFLIEFFFWIAFIAAVIVQVAIPAINGTPLFPATREGGMLHKYFK